MRVSDIIPPFHNDLIRESQNHKASNGSQNNPSAEQKNTEAESFEIPKFDIANQILTQQRKYSALRRVSPAELKSSGGQGQKETANIDSESPFAGRDDAKDIGVIKEIVRRDISKLCLTNHIDK